MSLWPRRWGWAGNKPLPEQTPSRGRPALGQAEHITARIVDAAWAVLLESGSIEQVIAEVTHRSVTSLSAPEALMLERLIDWIDRARPEAKVREQVYRDMMELLRGCLTRAIAQGQLSISDVDTATRFWLDGLIGHVRGLSRHDETLDNWPQTYARYFLRAIT